MTLSAKPERTRLNRSVQMDAKHKYDKVTHAAETRNSVWAACSMTEQGNSGLKMVGQATGQWRSVPEHTQLGECQFKDILAEPFATNGTVIAIDIGVLLRPAIGFEVLPTKPQFLALVVVHGALLVPIRALCISHANDNVLNSRMVETSGGLLPAFSIGATISPLAAVTFMGGRPHRKAVSINCPCSFFVRRLRRVSIGRGHPTANQGKRPPCCNIGCILVSIPAGNRTVFDIRYDPHLRKGQT
jgi:hypothetical protein